MKESQRLNPPSLLSMHRVMVESYTMKDGPTILRNAHVSVSHNVIQNDPEVTPEPDVFDGDGYYNFVSRRAKSTFISFLLLVRRF